MSKQPPSEVSLETDKLRSLQGVILADSYENKFWPVTLEGPRALIPVCNIPMIEYAIQFLLMNKIRHLIIFCTSFKTKIDDYFKKYRSKEVLSLQVVSSDDCKSVGDALRELKDMQLIQGDFVLMHCETIANFNILPALQLHFSKKGKREDGKINVLTKIYRRIGVNDPLRTELDDAVFVMNEETNQLIHIKNIAEKDELVIEDKLDISFGNKNQKICYNLYDTNVMVCSTEVLDKFMENFDYHNFRDDYMKDLLTSAVSDDKIQMVFIHPDEYAAKVHDFRVYQIVSEDIVSQKLQPFVIHRFIQKMQIRGSIRQNYLYHPDNIYISQDVERSLFGSVTNDCIIGRGTTFGEKVHLIKSIIGSDCKIGKNSIIENCIVWDNVTIGENCKIEGALICSGAIVGDYGLIEKGSVLSYGVELVKATLIKKFLVVSCMKNEMEKVEYHAFKKGCAYEKIIPHDERFQGFFPKFSPFFDDYSESSSLSSIKSEDLQTEEKFKKEVVETVNRVINGEITMENLIVEMNGLKFAENKTFKECLKCFCATILGELTKKYSENANDMIKEIKFWVDTWKRLFKEYIYQEEDGLAFIEELQMFCDLNENLENLKKSFHIVLQLFNQGEILNGDVIVKWADLKENDENSQFYLKICAPFVNWLRSSANDSEEEEEEGEEEDDK